MTQHLSFREHFRRGNAGAGGIVVVPTGGGKSRRNNWQAARSNRFRRGKIDRPGIS